MTPKNKIRKFIVENFLYGQDDAALIDDASFLENGIIDSTGILELVSFVQESFDMQVADEEIHPDNFDAISKITAFIQRKQEEKQHSPVSASQQIVSAG